MTTAYAGERQVLIWERDSLITQWLQETLEEAGVETHSVPTLATALQSIGERDSAIVIDVSLLDKDGDRIVLLLRQCDPTLPIIVLVSYASPFMHTRLRHLRVTLLRKPFGASQLFDALGRVPEIESRHMTKVSAM